MAWRIVAIEESKLYVLGSNLQEHDARQLRKTYIKKGVPHKDIEVQYYTKNDCIVLEEQGYQLRYYGDLLMPTSNIVGLNNALTFFGKSIKSDKLEVVKMKGTERVERHYDDASYEEVLPILAMTSEGECLWFNSLDELKIVSKDKCLDIIKIFKRYNGRSLKDKTIIRLKFNALGMAVPDYGIVSGNNNYVISTDKNGNKSAKLPELRNEFNLFKSVLPKVKTKKDEGMSEVALTTLRNTRSDLDEGTLFNIIKSMYISGMSYTDIRRKSKGLTRQVGNNQVKRLIDRVFDY